MKERAVYKTTVGARERWGKDPIGLKQWREENPDKAFIRKVPQATGFVAKTPPPPPPEPLPRPPLPKKSEPTMAAVNGHSHTINFDDAEPLPPSKPSAPPSAQMVEHMMPTVREVMNALDTLVHAKLMDRTEAWDIVAKYAK